MIMRTLVTTAALAALLCVAPCRALADDGEDAEVTRAAKEHYRLGQDAFKAGKYAEAIKELKKAHALKAIPILNINIAKTYDKLGDLDNEIYFYKKYIKEAPAAPNRADIESTIAGLEERKKQPPPSADPAADQPQAETPVAAEGEREQPADDASPPPRKRRPVAAATEEQPADEAPPPPRKRARPAPVEDQPVEEAPPPPRKHGRPAPAVEDLPPEEPPPADEPPPPPRRHGPRPAPVTDEMPPEEAPPPPPRKHKPIAPPPEAAAPEGPMATEWSHTPIDSVPPSQAVDVRVAMPVMKGVKVYLNYRAQGQAEFVTVEMKRRGADKIGRIPASEVAGKSFQYFIEAKDKTGTVVKSSGSQTDPNIVLIDNKARAQTASARSGAPTPDEGGEEASLEPDRRGGKGVAPSGSSEDEAPPIRKKKSGDEEAPPLIGRPSDEAGPPGEEAPMKSTSSWSRNEKIGWVLVGAGGLVAVGGAITGFSMASHYAAQVKNDACPTSTGTNCNNGNTDVSAGGGPDQPGWIYNDPGFPSNDKYWADLGHAGDIIGGVALGVGIAAAGAGAGILIYDYMQKHPSKKTKKKSHRAVDETPSPATDAPPSDAPPPPDVPPDAPPLDAPPPEAAPAPPQSSFLQHFIAAPVVSAHTVGVGAAFTF